MYAQHGDIGTVDLGQIYNEFCFFFQIKVSKNIWLFQGIDLSTVEAPSFFVRSNTP